jgi:mannitol/fructose-specific phosphotransferase system IIA component (Ntr-type)
LPRVISQRYPNLSLIITYPSEIEEESDQGLGYAQNVDILNKSRIKTDLTADSIEDALNEIISGDELFENIASERITRRLLENSVDYSPEMMPGVLFYESHTSKVEESALFIGISKKGINSKHAANQAYVIAIFLSPKEMKPQDHLRSLTKITRLIHPGKDVEELKNAKNRQEVLSTLLKRR